MIGRIPKERIVLPIDWYDMVYQLGLATTTTGAIRMLGQVFLRVFLPLGIIAASACIGTCVRRWHMLALQCWLPCA
jgi:hypothetical protein